MYRKCHALGTAWPLAILSVINHYVMISKLAIIFGFWPFGLALGHNVDCNFPKSNEMSLTLRGLIFRTLTHLSKERLMACQCAMVYTEISLDHTMYKSTHQEPTHLRTRHVFAFQVGNCAGVQPQDEQWHA